MLLQQRIGRCALSSSRQRSGCTGPEPLCRRLCRRSNAVTQCRGSVPPLRASGSDEALSGTSSPAQEAEVEVADGPWDPDFIRGMIRQQQEEEERSYGQALTNGILDDPEDLYYYLDEQYQLTELCEAASEATGEPMPGLPAGVANDLVGMGSWRLRFDLDPILTFLVPRIEGSWRELLDEDLSLYPVELWKEPGWDLVDSEDPGRELGGFSIADIPDPQPGAEGYPRLRLENRVYCSRVFRKLHVEVGIRQDGLQVLHVVLYPRYGYDLPIFGLDVVMVGDRVTLAVVDCCPVRKDLKLPAYYMQTMAELQRTFLGDMDPTSRRIPDWGAASFSPLAVCISPSGPEELAAFVKYAVALHRAHLLISLNATPVLAGPGDSQQLAKLMELVAGQKRFCDNQLSNKKTRRVLEKAFGEEWAEEYMSKLMFDCDPSYEPPFEDRSYEKLYEYFAENPILSPMEMENERMELEAMSERAVEDVQKAALGADVPQEKLRMAMDFLYQNDPTFRAAIEVLNSRQAEPDEVLTDELLNGLGRSSAEAASKK